jgi:hypothetical protein
MSEERKERRIAIVGTAPTWRDTPWDDPTLEVWALNDMHVLKLPRADRWYDLHPFHKMFFRKKDQPVNEHDVPAGYFVRPAGHLEWLKSQTIPVYVQDAALLGSPSAKTFPREAIVERFGPNFASTPAWMIAHALMEGATEIHIYGIHLATEWEYIRQKPNLLFFMGLAAALGCKLVLPRGCPLLTHTHQYAFEEDPDVPKIVLKRKLSRLQSEVEHLKKRKKAGVVDPNYVSRMSLLQAQMMDCQTGLQHVIAGRAPAGY